VMYSQLPAVGAVGGRLTVQDGRLQHVGIKFDNGLPGHPYHGFSGGYNGYANSVRVACDCLAVTGACLMTRRELFEAVGGFSETFPLNYNDCDYCLKLRDRGLRSVYDPDLWMVHFESSSRSTEVEDWEKNLIRHRWLRLTNTDPYSNPNLRREVPRLASPFLWALRRHPFGNKRARELNCPQ
jgi:GT2 family glycosyltransferase